MALIDYSANFLVRLIGRVLTLPLIPDSRALASCRGHPFRHEEMPIAGSLMQDISPWPRVQASSPAIPYASPLTEAMRRRTSAVMVGKPRFGLTHAVAQGIQDSFRAVDC